MQLRLFDVRQTGKLGAIACLLYEAKQEVAAGEYELAEESKDREDAETYLATWSDWRDQLQNRARAEGFVDAQLEEHGKLRFGPTARQAQQVSAYKTLYVRHSLAAHGSSSSTIYASAASRGLVQEEGGLLLPLDAYVIEMVGDALTQLFLCLSYASEVIDDSELRDDVVHALNHLQDEWARLSPNLQSSAGAPSLTEST